MADITRYALRGDFATVDRLLREGADVNARDWQGRTALHHTATGGMEGAVRSLLKRGADPSVRDGCGDTALALVLLQSAMFQHSMASLLIAPTLAAQAVGGHRSDLLLLPRICSRLSGIALLDDPLREGVKFMLHHGAPLDTRGQGGMTAAMHVARVARAHPDILRMLLSARDRVDVSACDLFGTSVLRHAMLAYDLVGVKMLLDAGADITDAELTPIPVSRVPPTRPITFADLLANHILPPMRVPSVTAAVGRLDISVGTSKAAAADISAGAKPSNVATSERLDVSMLQALRAASRSWRTGAYESGDAVHAWDPDTESLVPIPAESAVDVHVGDRESGAAAAGDSSGAAAPLPTADDCELDNATAAAAIMVMLRRELTWRRRALAARSRMLRR